MARRTILGVLASTLLMGAIEQSNADDPYQTADRWSPDELNQPAWVPSEDVTPPVPSAPGQPEGPIVDIYDNGPLSTGTTTCSGVAAGAGTTWSEVQHAGTCAPVVCGDSNTTAGFSCGITVAGGTTAFRLADDFTVPAGQTWRIDEVVVFAYQTGNAGTVTPFNYYDLRIWNAMPDEPPTVANILFGDTTTNRFAGSTNSGMRRIFNTSCPAPGTAPGTTRHIWRNVITVAPPLVLGPGTYWADWRSGLTTPGAHFQPSTTIVGSRGPAGANGRQFVGPQAPNAWQDALDAGNPATLPDIPQELSFILRGEITSTACALLGDMDSSGAVNGLDISPWVTCYLAGPAIGPGCSCADMDTSTTLTAADLPLFVAAMVP